MQTDRSKFATGFAALTASRNIGHASANLAWTVIQRSTAPPLSNQDFTPWPAISAVLQERGAEPVSKRVIQK